MTHRRQSVLNLLVVLALMLSLVGVTPASASPTVGSAQVSLPVSSAPSQLDEVNQPAQPDEVAVYIVTLSDAPLALYKGGVESLAPTSPAVKGEKKLNAKSPASVAYASYLAGKRAEAISRINEKIGRSINVIFQYDAVMNGFAAEMTAKEAAVIAKLPGVEKVELEWMEYIDTDAGPNWIGATAAWAGVGSLPGTKGEGVVVGVIDTGIDPWNPSFASPGPVDGYNYPTATQVLNNGGRYLGVCDSTRTITDTNGATPYDPTFPCNNKLIGVWGYTTSNPNPRDNEGHGSHTSSTAAGNIVHNTVITAADGTVFNADISGVAPHAFIIMYDGCNPSGCPGASTTAARNQAILDGVDVINHSIGSTSATPNAWTSTAAAQWLAVREAGIFVAQSAGNSGPNSATVGSPADIPWTTAVAASSHDRAFLNSVVMTNGIALSNTVTVNGQSMTGGFGPARIIYSTAYSNTTDARLCAPGYFPPGTFNGEIVVCERGTYGRVAKGQAVKDGGAGGMILAQPTSVSGPGSVVADPHVLPALHIDYFQYQILKAYLASAPVVTGTLTGATLDSNVAHADILADFSSRGPNNSNANILVPSVTAPGRSIWAAYAQGSGGDGNYTYNVIGGTSMAAPHVAGSAALLIALHPDWTPAQIESALMMTGRDTKGTDGVSAATPFEQGGGMVSLQAAPLSGLVLDVTASQFRAANPALGGDPRQLNRASLADGGCVVNCFWTRTFSSTQNTAVTYNFAGQMGLTPGFTLTVSPSSFTVPPFGTQVVTVTANVLGKPIGTWVQDSISFTNTAGLPELSLPVAVKPAFANLGTRTIKEDVPFTGSTAIADLLIATGAPTLTVSTHGMVRGTAHTLALLEDPTPDILLDTITGTAVIPVVVPASTARLVAEIRQIGSFDSLPDVDLYIYRDVNNNGVIDTGTDTVVCTSASGETFEYCNVSNPTAYTYLVLVQNYEASAPGVKDLIELVTAVVPNADSNNLDVTGPASVGAGEPYSLTIAWDQANYSINSGYWYGVFDVGSTPGSPTDLGRVYVNFTFPATPVLRTAAFGVSAPLGTLTSAPQAAAKADRYGTRTKPPIHPISGPNKVSGPQTPDPLAENSSTAGTGSLTEPIASFDGLAGTDNINLLGLAYTPPDTNGDIGYDPATGKKYYIQYVNVPLSIWDVTTPTTPSLVAGPLLMSELWATAGITNTPCMNDDGDPIVLFDQISNRWFMSQFGIGEDFGTMTAEYHVCNAVSSSADPLGTWYIYDYVISTSKLNDYPKFGIWPDGIYMSINQFIFPDYDWGGAGAAAFNRVKMVAGDPTAEMIYMDLETLDPYQLNSLGGMLPTDLEGKIPPPPGTPNYFLQADDDMFGYSNDQLQVWAFLPNWNATSASLFNRTQVIDLAAEGYSFNLLLCVLTGSRDCMPQPGGIDNRYMALDSIGDRLMHRMTYRNLGDHQSLVLNHTVATEFAGTHAGVRWYELTASDLQTRPQGGGGSNWVLNQGGTIAPDRDNRWMGSLTTDANGNIAVGYSVASLTTFPAVRYTGRLAGDPLGKMWQGEESIVEGNGSATEDASRWGDYSMLSVDPVDDCTFWYTNQYLQDFYARKWSTRIGAFKFPSCTTAASTGSLAGAVSTGIVPVPGARVEATDGVDTFVTYADSNGNYQFSTLGLGYYDVMASGLGYQASLPASVLVTGAAVQNLSLSQSNSVVVSGAVLDTPAYNKGIPAAIDITAPDYPTFHQMINTEADGSYSVALAADTDYHFLVTSPGYQSVEEMLTTPANGPATQDFTLAMDATMCSAPGYAFGSTLLSQDFETPLASAGWYTYATGITTTVGWQVGAPNVGTTKNGTGVLWHADLAGNNINWAVSPQFTVPAFGGSLTFYQRDRFQAYYNNHAILVTTASNPDPNVSSYAEFWHSDTTANSTNSRWVKQTIDLTPYKGQTIRLGFRYTGNFDDVWYVDEVRATACLVGPYRLYLPLILK